jgi:hypothetical protein
MSLLRYSYTVTSDIESHSAQPAFKKGAIATCVIFTAINNIPSVTIITTITSEDTFITNTMKADTGTAVVVDMVPIITDHQNVNAADAVDTTAMV